MTGRARNTPRGEKQKNGEVRLCQEAELLKMFFSLFQKKKKQQAAVSFASVTSDLNITHIHFLHFFI